MPNIVTIRIIFLPKSDWRIDTIILINKEIIQFRTSLMSPTRANMKQKLEEQILNPGESNYRIGIRSQAAHTAHPGEGILRSIFWTTQNHHFSFEFDSFKMKYINNPTLKTHLVEKR